MLSLTTARRHTYLTWVGVTILFFIVSWIHMGPSLTHCSTVVLSKAGDHTAGIIYNSWLRPNRPFLGTSTFTNYPYGENLWLPTSISTQLISTSHWVLSRLTSPVCAWNLLVLFGYMSSALIMFAFMRWLTHDSWIAVFAAYATTYTPFHVFSSWGHLTWLFSGLFVLALWQFISMWRKPSLFKGVLLGSIIGTGFYADGYFILVGIALFATFWASGLSYGLLVLKNLRKLKPQLRSLATASVTALFLLLPLVWVNHHYAAEISAYLGNVRGNILFDSQTYSAQLYMYLMPTELFPVIGRYTKDFQSIYFNNTGTPGLLFLGFSVVCLAIYGCRWLYKQFSLDNKKTIESNAFFFVGWTMLTLTFIGLWLSLRPISQIGNLTIYNPSYFIVLITSAWRVFGRLYILVNIGVVTLASLGLVRLLNKYPARRFLIIGASLLILVLELRMFPVSAVGPVFDYREVPKVYQWLHNNPEIRAIAEYPLDEPPQGKFLAHYFTFQQVSNKPILNTFLPNSPNMPLRRSIIGINDPQTLPVLRALGIDLVNVRPITPLTDQGKPFDARLAAQNNPELERLFSDNRELFVVDSFKIKPGKVADFALTIPSLNYSQIVLEENGTADYIVGDNISLAVIKMPYSKSQQSTVTVSFTIKSDSDRHASIVQNGKVVWSGEVGTNTQTVQFDASPDYPLNLYNQASLEATQFTISRLQIL